MKIVEKLDVSGWSYLCRCSNCETKLEIEAMDICHTHSQGDGIYPASHTYSVKCPACSGHIHVPVSVIPKIVQIEAQRRSTPSSSSYLDR